MRPPGPRAAFALLLLSGGYLLAAPAGPGSGSSGRFVSPERHECRWRLLLSAPGSAAGGGEVALRCRGPDGARLECAFRGPPGRCATPGAGRARHWRRLLRALRRRPRPCQDPAPLRARLCAGERGPGAELRLVPHAARDFPEEREPRAGSRGRPRSAAPKEKKDRAGRSKAAPGPDPERPARPRPDPGDGPGGNAELAETFCAEEWRSLCSFFVNFWNG